MIAYGGGFAVEAVCLTYFFAAAQVFWGGARWHFVAVLVAALLLSTISIAALERRIFEHAFAAFDPVEQQLGGPVPVQALPAAGQTGEAAQAAKPKRTAAKAITAEFQTLDASQTAESEGSSNGYNSFRR